MNKIMKKSIISLMTISSCLGSTTLLASAKEDNNEINPQTINITGNTVNYETYGKKECSYDLDTGKFEIEGVGSVVITTTVTHIYDDSFTEEEYLEMDKQKTIENFERLKNSVETYEYSVTGIPSNAPSVRQATFQKNIGQIVGQVGEVLTQISTITKLFSCPGMPYSGMFSAISNVTGLTGNTLKAASSKITSDWYYELYRTSKTYSVGNTTQYGYRYTNRKIIMHPVIKGKKHSDTPLSYGKTGSWWVNQKPY